MSVYILLIFQVLLSGMIIWGRKQISKEPFGCLAAGVVVMIVFVLTTFLFCLGLLVIIEGPLSGVFSESRGALAGASPEEWIMTVFICLLIVLMSVAICSFTGYALTGHHPKFCKRVWKTLAGILLFPILAWVLLGGVLVFAFIICMRIVSPMFDDIAWGWMILLLLFCAVFLLGFVGIITFLLEMNGYKLKEYDMGNADRSFRRMDMDKKGGAE